MADVFLFGLCEALLKRRAKVGLPFIKKTKGSKAAEYKSNQSHQVDA
jgi:hypothetical protein